MNKNKIHSKSYSQHKKVRKRSIGLNTLRIPCMSLLGLLNKFTPWTAGAYGKGGGLFTSTKMVHTHAHTRTKLTIREPWVAFFSPSEKFLRNMREVMIHRKPWPSSLKERVHSNTHAHMHAHTRARAHTQRKPITF